MKVTNCLLLCTLVWSLAGCEKKTAATVTADPLGHGAVHDYTPEEPRVEWHDDNWHADDASDIPDAEAMAKSVVDDPGTVADDADQFGEEQADNEPEAVVDLEEEDEPGDYEPPEEDDEGYDIDE